MPLTMCLRSPIPHTRQLYADESLYQRMLAHLAEKMPATDKDRERQTVALTAETLTLEDALVSYGRRFRLVGGAACA